MKRLFINIWVLIVELPLYVLVLALCICNWMAMQLIKPLIGTNVEPYEWCEILDKRMYKIYKGIWK